MKLRHILSIFLASAFLFVQLSSTPFASARVSFSLETLLEEVLSFVIRGPVFVMYEDKDAYYENPSSETVSDRVSDIEVLLHYPESKTIVAGASNVLFLELELYNTQDEDAFLESISFVRKGLGSPSDFESVALFMGLRRISPTTNVSSNGEATFRLFHAPILLPKNSSTLLGLRANLADTTDIRTHENSFILSTSNLRILSRGGRSLKVSYERTPTRYLTSVPVKVNTLEFATGPTVGNNTLLNLRLGSNLGHFTLSADSSEDILIKHITFKISQNRGLISNAELVDRTTGVPICSADSDEVLSRTISFSCFGQGYRLRRSASRIITIQGVLDLGFGLVSSTDTLEFSLDSPVDVIAATYPSGIGVKIIDNY